MPRRPMRFRLPRLVATALTATGVALLFPSSATALQKPEATYPIFQFPRDQIPRIDGDTIDWSMVPESYVIDRSAMHNTSSGQPSAGDATLSVRIRVGWVAGLNRLYFLYEAEDDCWDYTGAGLRNDTFEIMVDGDASGGPFVGRDFDKMWTPEKVGAIAAQSDPRITNDDSRWAVAGVHAQNYHIMTPAIAKAWAMAWGASSWTKEFPWANAAQSFHGTSNGPGKLTLEFWITPFDYAGAEGPARAVPSDLREDKIIGLSWIVIDYDGKSPRGFWCLSPERSAFAQASELCAFRLMPTEPELLPKIAADWSWQTLDADPHHVAFRDKSIGEITAWKWNFGDEQTSTARHPIHDYAKPGNYVVTLEVTGPEGTARLTKIWDIQLRP